MTYEAYLEYCEKFGEQAFALEEGEKFSCSVDVNGDLLAEAWKEKEEDGKTERIEESYRFRKYPHPDTHPGKEQPVEPAA